MRSRIIHGIAAWAALVCGGCGGPPEAAPERREVLVAAAADLQYALAEVLEAFHRMHPDVAVKPTYGSSGNLFMQIDHGAPFDLFLSADRAFPRRLVENGRADAETLFPYAEGVIVVWAPRDSPVPVGELGLEALTDARIRKVAIANPEHAPYGRAAVEAMTSLGLYDAVRAKLVFGENVAQAAHFVESGAADAGVIALSLARAPPMRDKGHYVEVPAAAYPAIEQGGVVPAGARHRREALLLRDWLLSPAGRAILGRYGFRLPGDASP